MGYKLASHIVLKEILLWMKVYVTSEESLKMIGFAALGHAKLIGLWETGAK